jgi:hypothetical protein
VKGGTSVPLADRMQVRVRVRMRVSIGVRVTARLASDEEDLHGDPHRSARPASTHSSASAPLSYTLFQLTCMPLRAPSLS